VITCYWQVLLQTAIVPVCCSDGSVITARVLLHSASQRTFMTNRMAKLLKLPSQRMETLSVCTFGSQDPQSIDTYVVHFSIITKDGTQLDLQANVLNQITSPIQRGPLDIEFLQLISPTQLADLIPESLEMASIDILVGSDFFWSIVGSGRVVLPSGLFLLSSKLVYLLIGKFLDPRSDGECDNHQLLAYFVMIYMFQK